MEYTEKINKGINMSGNTSSGKRKEPETDKPGDKVHWKQPKPFSEDSKKYWNRYYTLLNDAGVLNESDYDAFVRLCRIYGMFLKCAKVVDKYGSTYKTKSDRGAERILTRPEADYVLRYSKELSSIENKFGLTPGDRQNIKAFKTKKSTSTRDRYKKDKNKT